MRRAIHLDYVATPVGPIHLRRGGARALGASPIVLLHHTPSSSASMVALVAALAPRWCVAPDLPGFGDSPALAGTPEVSAWADAIAHALRRLEIAGATVLGHHAGASVAAELAAEHPPLVARLILSAPPPVDAPDRAELAARLRPPSSPAVDLAHLEEVWSRVSAKAPDLPLPLHHREAVLALVADRGYGAAFRAVLDHDLGAAVARVRCPVWVTTAPDDPLAPFAARTAARVRARFRPLPTGGLHVFDLHPEDGAALVRSVEEHPS